MHYHSCCCDAILVVGVLYVIFVSSVLEVFQSAPPDVIAYDEWH